MRCEEAEELAGAYALGALPPAELREVEEHLHSCVNHPDIAELSAVARSLALAAPDTDPSPALRERIMVAVGKEPHRAAAAPSRLMGRIKGWFSRPAAAYAIAGSMAVVALALLAWNVSLQSAGDDTVVRSFPPGGAAVGTVTYIPNEELAVLALEDMAAPPTGKTYQVWSIADGAATGVGFLEVAPDGRVSEVISTALSPGDEVAITVEPAGGSAQPTTTPILRAKI